MTDLPRLALLGDLVASRESPRRAAVQAALGAALERINFEVRGQLAAPAAQTAGDEVQVLFDPLHAEHVMDVVRRLTDALYGAAHGDALLEQRIVFGLGCGPLSTGPLPDDGGPVNVALLDGPCFHRAREALQEASRGGRWLVARGFDRPRTPGPAAGLAARADALLSTCFELTGSLRAGWTPLQAHYAAAVRAALEEGGRGAQKRVAEEKGVSPSVISESLKASRHDLVLRAEEQLAGLLHELGALVATVPESA